MCWMEEPFVTMVHRGMCQCSNTCTCICSITCYWPVCVGVLIGVDPYVGTTNERMCGGRQDGEAALNILFQDRNDTCIVVSVVILILLLLMLILLVLLYDVWCALQGDATAMELEGNVCSPLGVINVVLFFIFRFVVIMIVIVIVVALALAILVMLVMLVMLWRCWSCCT